MGKCLALKFKNYDAFERIVTSRTDLTNDDHCVSGTGESFYGFVTLLVPYLAVLYIYHHSCLFYFLEITLYQLSS
jgi:hypothetical protein